MMALVALTLALAVPAAARDLDGARLVDLTHPFDARTIYWPTAKPFTLEPVAHGMTEGGWWYAANNFSAAEHGGTHLDAPIHFAEGRWAADEIPLDRLVGAAVVVDVSEKAARDPDALLVRADLETFEGRGGRIPDGAVVLVRTGWDRFWDDRARYVGSAAPGDTAHLHFPGVGEDAALWLTTARRIRSIGIDTASIDHGPSRDFRAHRALTNANVPIFENLAGLAALPPRGATFIGLPMKIAGGSGGPPRGGGGRPPPRAPPPPPPPAFSPPAPTPPRHRRGPAAPRAVALLGLSTVRNLALGVKVWDTLGTGMAQSRPEELWAHALAVGVAAKTLAARLRAGDPDEAFTAGVLHDVGRLVLAMRFREEYWRVVGGAGEAGAVERKEGAGLGVDHAQGGGRVLEAWGLPPPIVEAPRAHHNAAAPPR